jgi:adenylate cyclase
LLTVNKSYLWPCMLLLRHLTPQVFVFFCVLALPFGSVAQQTISQLEMQYTKTTDKIDKQGRAFELAEKFLAANNALRASEYAGAAYKLATENGNKVMAARSAILGAEANLKQGRPADAKTRLDRATNSAIEGGDFALASKALGMLEDMAIQSGNYTEAYQIAKREAAMYRKSGATPSRPAPAPERPSTSSPSAPTATTENPRIKTLESDNAILRGRLNQLEVEIQRLGGERDVLRTNSKKLTEQGEKVLTEREEARKQLDAQNSTLLTAEEQRLLAEQRDKRKQKLVEALTNERSLDSIVYEQDLQAKQLEIAKYNLSNERNENLRNILLLVSGAVLLLAFFLYRRFRESSKNAKALSQKNEVIKQEQERSDELLLNILPADIATELKLSGKAIPRKFENATVLFSDFKNFTQISERLTPEQLVYELDHCFKAFDFITNQHKVEKIKTIGDAYMCATGLKENNQSPPVNLIQAAIEMQEFLKDYRQERIDAGLPYFEARIGIHSGEVVAGVVGVNKFAYDIWGDTVNVASRMESQCEPGQINISETTYYQIKYDYDCLYRGRIEAKHKGEIEMYYVQNRLKR